MLSHLSQEGASHPEEVRVMLKLGNGCRGAGCAPHPRHHTRRHTHLPDSIKQDSSILALSDSALSDGKSKMAVT